MSMFSRWFGFVLRRVLPGKLVQRLRKSSGQSFVELALVLPLLLVMLIGMVEVGFGMFVYLTALDLTREAARFASTRDYNEQDLEDPGDPSTACTDGVLHYFYDTACFFTDPTLNAFLDFKAEQYADVVITVYTIAGNQVTAHHPESGYWSLYNDNWKKDCHGNVVRTTPPLTDEFIESRFSGSAPADRGIVAVEAWLCYDLLLGIPYIPSPLRIHAYTIMPASEAIPTPTPIASP